MLYLSHKAVHARFLPAERHKGRYADMPFRRRRQWRNPGEYDGHADVGAEPAQ